MCVTEQNHQFYLNSLAVIIIIIGEMLMHLLYWFEIDVWFIAQFSDFK
jgi:hypothetical protein